MIFSSLPAAEVVIVGAGPVGLTLAIALAQLGVAVRILEKSPATKTQPRAAIIWQRAAEAWGLLGVMPRIEAQANPLSGIDIHHRGALIGGIELGNISSRYPHPLILEQHVTERLLADRLRGLDVEVEWSTELTNLHLEPGRACLEIEQCGKSTTLDTPWVVGCDGSHSLVRARAGIPFPGRARKNLQCLTLDAIPEWRYSDTGSYRGRFFLAPEIALGCFPLPGHDGRACRFYAFAADLHPERDTADPTLQEMQALIARVAGTPELNLTLTEPRWLRRARFQDRIARTLRQGRAFIAGDSAHVWAPIAGHGMNTGILGAANLAWKLAAVVKGEAPESLLDTYTDEQTAAARLILRQTKLDFIENIHPAPVLSLLAKALPTALRSRWLQRWIDSTLSSLPLTHHGNSPLAPRYGQHANLTTPIGERHILKSGDRFPYHALNIPYSASYGRWLLMLTSSRGAKDPDTRVASVQTLANQYRTKIDVQTFACAPQSTPPQVIAIRPDTHIGYIAGSDNLTLLSNYLDRFIYSHI